MTPAQKGKRWKQTHIRNKREQRAEQNVAYRGDNFRFVCWGDVTELKLWRRR